MVVEELGWDEAFLGVRTDDPEALARDVQRAVLEVTALSCAVGIGDNTLRATTVAELTAAEPARLAGTLGPSMGPWYVQLAQGVGRTEVIGTPWVPRSRSHETTFQRDLTEWAQVRAKLAALTRRVAADVVMRRAADGSSGGEGAVRALLHLY